MRDSKHSEDLKSQRVPTRIVFSILALALSWELEIAVLVLHVFTPESVDVVTHTIIACVSLSLTFLWYTTGRLNLSIYRQHASATLTATQMLLVTLFMVACGVIISTVITRIVDAI